jgi:TetR/AcrR family transcriptional repressor of mexJK operon
MSSSHSATLDSVTFARRGGRPSLDAAAALPDRILASARERFLDKGFAATSMEQIAAGAGTTKRTLYVKVGDKEALFSAVITDMLADWRGVLDRISTSGKLQARLEQVGQQLLRALLEPDIVRLNRVLFAEVHRFPGLVQLLVQQAEAGPIPRLAVLLMEQRGAVERSREDIIAARMLYDMISGPPLRTAMTGREPPIAISLEEWVQQAVSLFLQGWQSRAGMPVS